MSELPSISVVFPTYNRCDVVERTLQHLLAQDYPADRFEIIAVDNSTDGTPDMVRRVAARSAADGGPRVILDWVPERLPAVKRNRGLRQAEGELVMFINDDLWLEPQALAEHAASHGAHSDPVAVLGWCRQSPEMPSTPFVDFYEPFAYSRMDHLVDQAVPYEMFWSMNLSLPRRVMLDRNLVFHEDWAHIGHEDVELGWRWTQAGLAAIYNPRARGDHFHPHTVASACRLQESVGRGLRDLEALVADPGLLERYGVRSRRTSLANLVRFTVRDAVVNRWTAPPLARWLDGLPRSTPVARWLYWKVLMHHCSRGYRTEPRRSPAPLVTEGDRQREAVGER